MRRRWPLLLFLSLKGLAQTSRARADDTIAALVDRAREQAQGGKIVESLKLLEQLEKRSEHDPEAKLALGEMLQELAAMRAEQLQRVAPESAAAHELLGKSLESRGKLDDALAQYRLALTKAPEAPGVHFLIGNVEWKQRNLEAAEAELRAELKLNPHHAMANLRMGQIALDVQRDEPMRAVAYLQAATTDAQSSLEAHRELGKALRLAHRYSEAVKELQLVEQRAPSDESIHAQLSALYKETGDKERARQEIELHARILRAKLQASQKAREQQIQ